MLKNTPHVYNDNEHCMVDRLNQDAAYLMACRAHRPEASAQFDVIEAQTMLKHKDWILKAARDSASGDKFHNATLEAVLTKCNDPKFVSHDPVLKLQLVDLGREVESTVREIIAERSGLEDVEHNHDGHGGR
jgi:hypothetical protein